jgi:hypothetical protein
LKYSLCRIEINKTIETKQKIQETRNKNIKQTTRTKTTQTMAAMKASNVVLSKISLSTPKTLDNGGKMIFLNYDGGMSPLFLQTPEVEIPFDPSYYSDSDTSGKYQIKFSLKNMEDNPDIKAFHDKIQSLDELLKQKAIDNSVPWFKKKTMTLDTIDSLYSPMIKVSIDAETGEPNGKYPPSFGFKVVKKDNKVLCTLYDKQKNVFDVNKETDSPVDILNVLRKGSKIKAVLKCNGVWLANGKFGCTWRAEQVRATIPEGGLKDFAIQTDSEDEGDEVVNEKVLIDDSDEDEVTDTKKEEEEEDEGVELTREDSTPKKNVKKVRKIKVKTSPMK